MLCQGHRLQIGGNAFQLSRHHRGFRDRKLAIRQFSGQTDDRCIPSDLLKRPRHIASGFCRVRPAYLYGAFTPRNPLYGYMLANGLFS